MSIRVRYIAVDKTDQLLDHLRATLENSDTDALEVLDELQRQPKSPIDKDDLNELSQAIGSHDFDRALVLLKQFET